MVLRLPFFSGATPTKGCEVFVGKIPRDLYEDELVPVFEKIGKIYELRLMMDFSGSNRGYAFVMYTSTSDARRAVKVGPLMNQQLLLNVCTFHTSKVVRFVHSSLISQLVCFGTTVVSTCLYETVFFNF